MNALQSFILSCPCSFITAADMPRLIELDRLCPVLVRAGACRFTCAADNVAYLISCLEAKGDYCRDVSFPVGSLERAAGWVGNPAALPKLDPAPGSVPVKVRQVLSDRVMFNEGDCGGVFDGFSVSSDADSGL